MGGLMNPSGQHFSQFVKLVDHRRDDEPDDTSHDGNRCSHRQQDGDGTDLDMEFLLDELHDGIEQVCEKPCYKERKQYATQIVGDVEYCDDEGNNTSPSDELIECNLLTHLL